MAELNSTILDAVWLSGTNDYQQRVPNTTQGDISQVISTLYDPMNQFLYNQFVDSLIMRIGNTKIHSNSWANPLGNLKGDMLRYGNTMQEWAPKWIMAHSYNNTRKPSEVADFFASDLLNVYKPEGQAWYHSVNRQDKYPISISDEELRRAFTDDYGLNNFISSVLQVPVNSDNYDEYRIMLQLTAEYMNRWGGYVDVLTNDPSTDAGAKELLRKVRTYTGELQFPSARFNAQAVDTPVFVKPDELVLLITPELESYMDVNVLSATFHVELADVNVRRVIVDEFPVPNVVAMLVSKDWFVVHDKVYQTNSFYNPAELITTYWLHHWEICSCSPYMPCIYFMYGSGSATTTPTRTFTITKLDGAPYEGVNVDAEYNVLTGDGIVKIAYNLDAAFDDGTNLYIKPDSVTFDVSVANADNSTGKTYVVSSENTPAMFMFTGDNVITDPENFAFYDLHIGDNVEDGDTITIVATSTYINPSGATTTYDKTITITTIDGS